MIVPRAAVVASVAAAGVRAFQRDGHVRVPAVFSREELAQLDAGLQRAKTLVQRPAGDADRSLTRDAFLSRHSEEVAAFTRDPRLGALAARLLGARRIRLIHDVLLEKSYGQGETQWHRDCDFWSFDGIGALTAWIPLQDTSLLMSPLRYATGSHRSAKERPTRPFDRAIAPFRYRIHAAPLAAGDVVVHHHRTLHGAARNHDRRPRRAWAVHFIDGDARFRLPRCAEQLEHAMRCGWMHLRDGEPFTDEVAPLIYEE